MSGNPGERRKYKERDIKRRASLTPEQLAIYAEELKTDQAWNRADKAWDRAATPERKAILEKEMARLRQKHEGLQKLIAAFVPMSNEPTVSFRKTESRLIEFGRLRERQKEKERDITP